VAVESADHSHIAVLEKLDDFRGHSRFTTWAYRFALLEAAVKMRRRPWQRREISSEMTLWPGVDDGRDAPDLRVERDELLSAVRDAIGRELSTHQREVLVAVILVLLPAP
jgi:RNA polymerase sigma-70 factor, ECF subfamily